MAARPSLRLISQLAPADARWTRVGLGVAAAHFLWLVTGSVGADALPWLDDLSWSAMALVTVRMCWAVARSPGAPPDIRRTWELGTGALFLILLSAILWGVADLFGLTTWVDPIGVVGLLYLPMLVGAMLVLPTEVGPNPNRWRRVFDALIVGIAGGLLLWLLVLERVSVAPDAPLATQIVAYGYPMGDLLTLYVIAATWLRRPVPVAAGALALITLSLVASFVGDLWYSLQSSEYTAAFGADPRMVWLLSAVCGILAPAAQLAALADHARFPEVPRVPAPPSAAPFTLAALVAAVLLLQESDFEPLSEAVAVLGAVSVMMLVVLRQWLAHREHADVLEHQARLDARFAALVDGSSDVITVVDAGGLLAYISPSVQRILGYAPADIIGTPITSFFHPDEVQSFVDLYSAVLARSDNTVTPASSWRVRASDGSYRILQATATNRLNDPAVDGVILNGRDITDQRRLEDRLQQARQMEAIGRFASVIAHDFNHVLSAIKLNVELLAATTDDTASTTEVLNALNLGTGLTRQLLAVSQHRAAAPVVLDLAAVVRESERILRPLLGGDVRLVLEPGSDPVFVRADVAQLRQVLLNLVVNARDATPRGTITIRVGQRTLDADEARALVGLKPGPHATLQISDTGAGMSAEVLDRLFEPYFTTKSTARGSGLGLTIVYGIVTGAGGHIRAESPPGGGSVFEILLPMVDAGDRSTPVLDVAAPRDLRTHILIVDDDPAIRFALQRSFATRGYDVVVAEDGEAALAALRRPGAEVHVVLTDMRMPRLDGPGLITAMSAEFPHIPVLGMSGYLHADDHARLSARVGALIEKPFTLDEVHRAVERVLA